MNFHLITVFRSSRTRIEERKIDREREKERERERERLGFWVLDILRGLKTLDGIG